MLIAIFSFNMRHRSTAGLIQRTGRGLDVWQAWRLPEHVNVERGYARLYFEQVSQAEDGCDFDFLRKHPRNKAAG
jgi:hypothetical protein